LTRWFLAQGVTDLERRIVAIDGKTLRGSQGHQLPGVHLLAAFCRDVEAVIAQLSVPGKTNEHKTALELLKLIPLKGTLITGDAAFTQRDLCEAVVTGGRDYFLTVKDNRPTLEAEIRAAFGPAFSPSGGEAAGHRRRPGRGPRQGPRSGGDPPDSDDHAVDGIPRLARGEAGVPVGAGAAVQGQADHRDCLSGHQPRPRASLAAINWASYTPPRASKLEAPMRPGVLGPDCPDGVPDSPRLAA